MTIKPKRKKIRNDDDYCMFNMFKGDYDKMMRSFDNKKKKEKAKY